MFSNYYMAHEHDKLTTGRITAACTALCNSNVW